MRNLVQKRTKEKGRPVVSAGFVDGMGQRHYLNFSGPTSMDLSVEFRKNKDIALAGMTGIYTNRLTSL